MDLLLSFELTGMGWAKCDITDGESACTVTASYLSNALGSLVLAATAVQAGFSRLTFSFEEEPGEFRWAITSPRINEINLSIFAFDSAYNELPDSEGILLFRTRCLPFVFADAVATAASNLLGRLGRAGYDEQWAEHTFPEEQLAELNRLLKRQHGA